MSDHLIWSLRVCAGAAAAFASLALPSTVVTSAAAQEWTVDGKLLGGARTSGGFKKSENASGMACRDGAPPRLCLVADDEAQAAQIVILGPGEVLRAGDRIPLIDDSFDGEPVELDAEAVAYADGAFFVTGSHGRPRHEDRNTDAENDARTAAARHIFRIRLDADAVDMATGRIDPAHPPTIDRASLDGVIEAEPTLKPYFGAPLAQHGLTIEGLAVRDATLWIGMRGPVRDGRALVLATPIAAVFDDAEVNNRLHSLDLGPDTLGNARGIRDLVADGGRFLVLAGPEVDPAADEIADGDYSVFAWDGEGSAPAGRFDLESVGRKAKPEALVPLGPDGPAVGALVLFDGPDEGRPTRVRLDLH
jgi:hypothetical protein